MTSEDAKLMKAFHVAALFLIDQVENHGWKKFSSNYLREHVRCRYGYKFTNSRSPDVLRMVRDAHPELRKWIDIKSLKDNRA